MLHEGYWRFLDRHARGRRLFVIGPALVADYRPLAKDIRALDPGLVAAAIDAWGICSEVFVLDEGRRGELAAERPSLMLPAEDVSYQVVERYFERCEVRYDTVFLRWDKTRSVAARPPRPHADRRASSPPLAEAARPARSVDWWRQVGAAMRLPTAASLPRTTSTSRIR